MCGSAVQQRPLDAMQDQEFTFEDWLLCPARRELSRAGVAVALERRGYDLLVFLVRHHGRVVTKEELLDAVWPGEPVSVGVIARAVMKARQALGDEDREGRLIRTAPRVGYRFVAPVAVRAGRVPEAAPAPGLAPSVALLPFENRTGRPEFDWVELGLLSLTIKALSGDPRLSVASVTSVLLALGRTTASEDTAARAEMLRVTRGVQRVVQCAVRAEAGGFALDMLVQGDGSWSRHQLIGNDLPALGRSAADLLEQVLQDGRARTLPAAYPVTDPFAARALMRGLQASAEQRWQEAANLFRVVLDAEPKAREIELEYLRALAPLGDDRALVLGERMLTEARAESDPAREADIRQSLGRTHLNKGLLEPAKQQLDASIALAAQDQLPESRTLTLLLRSSIAVVQRDFGRAHELLLQAQQLCEPHGNLHHRLWSQVGLAVVRARIGDLEGGYRAIGVAVQMCGGHRLQRDHATTVENQARLAVQLGRFDEAIAAAALAMDLAEGVGATYTMSFAAETLCLLGRLTERPDIGAKALRALGARIPTGLPGTDANAAMARGHQAWAEGRLADAVREMESAVSHYEQSGAWLSAHDMAPWLIAACLEAGERAKAEHWLRQAEHFPSLAADAVLQSALGWLRVCLAPADAARSVSLQLAQRVADLAPAGLWNGLIGLDLVRRLTDAGEQEMAAHRLWSLASWIDALPAGRRLAVELGRAPA
jgi:DNA-binding winged helix-turn-helix (wHTH) protein/tetratricopeptide (TPR) repeat protein